MTDLARAYAWSFSGEPGADDLLEAAHYDALLQLGTEKGVGWDPETRAWRYDTAQQCTAVPDGDGTTPTLRWWDPAQRRCVAGDRESAEWCDANGRLTALPDPETGIATCEVTPSYCESVGTLYSDGDCRVDFATALLEMFVGVTAARGLNWVTHNPDRALEESARLAVVAAGLANDVVAKPLLDAFASGNIEQMPHIVYNLQLAAGRVALRGVRSGQDKANDVVESLAAQIDAVCPEQVCGPMKAIIPIQLAWRAQRFLQEQAMRGVELALDGMQIAVDAVFNELERVVPIGAALDAMGLTPYMASATGYLRVGGGYAAEYTQRALAEAYQTLHVADALRGVGTGFRETRQVLTDASRAVYTAIIRGDPSQLLGMAGQIGDPAIALGNMVGSGVLDASSYVAGGLSTALDATQVDRVAVVGDPATWRPVGDAFGTAANAIAGGFMSGVNAVGSALGIGGGGVGARDFKMTGVEAECMCYAPNWGSVNWTNRDICAATAAKSPALQRTDMQGYARVAREQNPRNTQSVEWDAKTCRVGLEQRVRHLGGYDNGDVVWWSRRSFECAAQVRAALPGVTGPQTHYACSAPPFSKAMAPTGPSNEVQLGAPAPAPGSLDPAALACLQRGWAEPTVPRSEVFGRCAVDTGTNFALPFASAGVPRIDGASEVLFTPPAFRSGAEALGAMPPTWTRCRLPPAGAGEYDGPLTDTQLPYAASTQTFNTLEDARRAASALPPSECGGITRIGSTYYLRRDGANPTPLRGAVSWVRRDYGACLRGALQ
jgi:hypothetical protein